MNLTKLKNYALLRHSLTRMSIRKEDIRSFLLSPRPGLYKGELIPIIEAKDAEIKPDFKMLQRYCELCDFSDNNVLPPTFPHLLALPQMIEILCKPVFPLKAIGIVHTGQAIISHRPLNPKECLKYHCYLEGNRYKHVGVEFDLITLVTSNNELVWEGISTFLAKTRPFNKKLNLVPQPIANALVEEEWELAANLGRHYAVISGDFNPIHLFRVTAKPFGFKNPIIHGMYPLARMLATLQDHMPAYPGLFTSNWRNLCRYLYNLRFFPYPAHFQIVLC
ncbi:MaoC/PaaZ C-terminal domain-containing protein [Deltaproteobacteria bacterium TL4]